MALVRFDPFADLQTLHDQINSFFNSTSLPIGQIGQVLPTTDVYTEDDKQMTVEVQLPNFDEKEVEIDVREHVLTIKAEHSEKEESKKKRNYMVRESSTSFFRQVALPRQADESKIDAHFDKGVLKVVVPFKELPKPTKVAITANKKK
jgi:HSP20 family protein